VSTGASIILRRRSAWAAAISGFVTTKGSPWPARAMPSIRWRFTDVPMPKANTLLLPRFLRTSWKTSFSTVT
jgi:hypothetical protein